MKLKCRLSALIQGAEQKYNIKCFGITTIFMHSPPIFRGSNVIGPINIFINKMYSFNILLRIICRQWLPEAWNSWTSPKTGFSPLWGFAMPLLQLTSVVVCFRVFLPLVLSLASEMHAQSGWDQEIDMAIADYFTFLTKKTPGLFLLYVLGHGPFVLWGTAQSTFAFAFGWIWAESISLYTSEFTRMLLSSCHIITKHQ